MLNNDPDVEILVRNSIIDQFSKKHLKSITNSIADKFMGEANKVVTEIMEERIGKFEKAYGNYGTHGSATVFKLKPEVKKEITEQIDKDVRAEIQDIIKLHFAELNIEALVGEAVGRYVTAKINEEVNSQVTSKIKQAFQKLNI